MLIFIDDSGDAGFNFAKGSGKYFVIAIVIFDDVLEAERTAVAIKELKRELGFPDGMEFKFNKSRSEIRKRFLECISHFQFRIRSIVVDKYIIRSEELQNSKDSFYSYIIKMSLRHNNNTISNARVKIDGSGDRLFRKNFLTYLRRELNSEQRKIIKHCRLVNSANNVLIQMADMIAGAIRISYHDGRTDTGI